MCDGAAWGGRKGTSVSQSRLDLSLYELRQDNYRVSGVEETSGHLLVGHWELLDQPNKKENKRTNSLGPGSDPNVVSLKLTQFGCLLKTKNINLPHFCKFDKNRRPCQHVLGPLGRACAREGP